MSTTRSGRNIWPTLLLCGSLLCTGGIAGFFLRPIIIGELAEKSSDDSTDDSGHSGHDHGSNMVSIAESSMAYLGLEIGKFQRRDYFQNIRVPAEIVERIPEGRRHITSTFQGRIKQVYVTKGQAVAPGDKLFELRVMDNELSASQVELLDTLSKLEANEKQLARLKPLVESGVVAGKRILEFQLEKEKLQQKKEALSQGLDIQGMDADQLKKLITEQQLFRVVTVTAPPLKPDFQASEPRQDAELKFSSVALSIAPNSETGYFTVESISALEEPTLSLETRYVN
ncbi:MAG: efflux RND transporter periplasmic adaptor subunit [Planctomycetota bacterium]